MESEIRKRKEYAEKKVRERHAMLRKEAEERRKATNEHRERVQSQLKREQVLIQKRMQQLNEDEERKKATLAKQHEVTSRMAAINKSPKSFAFGSSTPRTLAYLDNLPKSEQQYDKKLKPVEGSFPATPTSTSPTSRTFRSHMTPQRPPPASHRPAPAMNAMTSSMYVTSSAPSSRPPKTISKAVTGTTKRPQQVSSMMTQSVYTPKMALPARNTFARPTKPNTPKISASPSTRTNEVVKKPPMPKKTTQKPKSVVEVVNNHETPIAENVKEEVEMITQKVEEEKEEEKVANENITEDVKIIIPQETQIIVEEDYSESNHTEKEETVIPTNEEPIEQVDVPEIKVETEPIAEITEVPEKESEIVVETEKPEENGVSNEETQLIEHSDSTSLAHLSSEKIEENKEEKELLEDTKEAVETVEKVDDIIEVVLEQEKIEKAEDTIVSKESVPTQEDESEVPELIYPMPTTEVEKSMNEPVGADNLGDLVDVFGNDFIVHQQPHRVVEFDEDRDSGKASPTSSETSSTTDEITPRTVVEQTVSPKIITPRALPIVKSAEDIERKEREAREAEERRSKVAAILAKARQGSTTIISSLPGAVDSDSTQSPTSPPPTLHTPTTPIAPIESAESGNVSSTTAAVNVAVKSPLAQEEGRTSNDSNQSEILSKLLSNNHLPSLQRLLQRKQGSNPSLETSESNGGEILS